MRRLLVLTLAAVVVIVGGIAVAASLAFSNVASASFNVGGERTDIWIYERDGVLFAEASQSQSGQGSFVRVGAAKIIGRDNPVIVDDQTNGQVLLRVGKATVIYDSTRKQLGNPAIAE